MSLDTFSRYRFCVGREDSEGRVFLDDRRTFEYRDRADNRIHTVKDGDTIFLLSAKYFSPLPFAADLWYAIADYQVDSEGNAAPIHDPTVSLVAGSILVIPSVNYVLEILSETHRFEHDAV